MADREQITIIVDGESLKVAAGQSVAAALLRHRGPALRRSVRLGEPRGLFCGMGICHECLVTIDGVSSLRACVTGVRHNMKIETGLR